MPTLNRAVLTATILSVFGLATASSAAEPTPAEKIIDGFLQTFEKNDQLSDEQRKHVQELVGALRQDADFKSATITEALREIYPKFSEALEALGAEKVEPAVAALEELSKSEDAYLAAESQFFLARAYLMEDRFEKALPILTELAGEKADKSLHAGEAQFLKGISESRLLLRKEAIASLDQFLKDHADAPERMRDGAWRHKTLLELIEEGSIGDVQEHMDYSRRKLALEQPGKQTQEVQDRIIAMLDKLIKEAESKESSSSSQGAGEGEQEQGEQEGEGEGEGQKPGQKGSGEKGNTGGMGQSSAKALKRVHQGSPEYWSNLYKRVDNPRTFSALRDKFPARYRQLIEQYYKGLQEGAEE